MNNMIRNRMNEIKGKLMDTPDGILLGKIGEVLSGEQEIISKMEAYTKYVEFLREFNGASLGEIELFPLQEAERNQFYVDHLLGGKVNWRCIGHILYEPLVIKKDNGYVYRIYRDSEEDEPTECFGCFDDFVMNYALGDKYRTVVPIDTDDLWVKLLIEGDGKYES